jgi:hypothetical protein
MVRFGCLRELGGKFGMEKFELASEGERRGRVDPVALWDDFPLLWVFIDARRCQAGGGFSGSPDSCRCKLLTVATGEGGPDDWLCRGGDCDRDRECWREIS